MLFLWLAVLGLICYSLIIGQQQHARLPARSGSTMADIKNQQQQKLSQQPTMSQQLQQAIKLLQMSRAELMESVQQSLLENPFLEEAADAYGQDSAIGECFEDFSNRNDNEMPYRSDDLIAEAEWLSYLRDLSGEPKNASGEIHDDDAGTILEKRQANRSTLASHLMWQLRLSSLTERQMAIGECVIGNLDSVGYLRATSLEIASMAGASEDEAESVIKAIQLFDPVGVAARNASECLLVQLQEQGYGSDPVLPELVKSHLQDLEEKRYKPILKKFHLEQPALDRYLDIIKTLDPTPGASFGDAAPIFVSPDLYVFPCNGDFVVMLNDEEIPKLALSSLYKDPDEFATEKEREYAKQNLESAQWLIKSLNQRNQSLFNVMTCITKRQREFFESGPSRLKPLVLKDIAEDVGMHESTVSRITTNKYCHTPYGIFELKFFFNRSVELNNGSQIGTESIKALIRQYISEEDPSSPVSDEKLGEMLEKKLGISIARRTVAKYRVAMDIPSSSKRKSH